MTTDDIGSEQNIEPTNHPYIVKQAGVCGGVAIVEGARIAVWHIVGYYYKAGMSVEEIIAEWSALAYYHDHRPEIDQLRAQNAYHADSHAVA